MSQNFVFKTYAYPKLSGGKTLGGCDPPPRYKKGLKSLKKFKKLPWPGIEPRSDDWQAKKGQLSQLFNSNSLFSSQHFPKREKTFLSLESVSWRAGCNRGYNSIRHYRNVVLRPRLWRTVTISTTRHFNELPNLTTNFLHQQLYKTMYFLSEEFWLILMSN